MAIEYNFTLDMDRSKRDNNIAYARTGDVDSITINADLVLNGAAYTPTGANAFFECITPNGHSIRAAAEKTGSTVSVEVPSAAFQAAGVINVAYFRFESGEADNPTYVESTEPFAIVVREGIGGDVDAGDYIEEWRQLADQLEAIVAEVEQKAEQAETAINEQKAEVDQLKAQVQTSMAQDAEDVSDAKDTAISNINSSQGAVDAAIEQLEQKTQEAVDVAQEALAFVQPAIDSINSTNSSVQAAEAKRVTAEQGRASAEQGRVTAEQGRVSAENARVSEFAQMKQEVEDAEITATASTGAPGSDAIVQTTGTGLNKNFAFTIPKGDKGDPGDPGQTATSSQLGVVKIGDGLQVDSSGLVTAKSAAPIVTSSSGIGLQYDPDTLGVSSGKLTVDSGLSNFIGTGRTYYTEGDPMTVTVDMFNQQIIAPCTIVNPTTGVIVVDDGK